MPLGHLLLASPSVMLLISNSTEYSVYPLGHFHPKKTHHEHMYPNESCSRPCNPRFPTGLFVFSFFLHKRKSFHCNPAVSFTHGSGLVMSATAIPKTIALGRLHK